MRWVRLDGATVNRYLAGDLLAVAAFVVAGQLRHGTLLPVRFAGVLAPFLVGWLLAAPVAGAYRADCRESVWVAAGWAVLAWMPAAAVAQALRATPAFPGDADPAFFAVTLGVGAAGLAIWRSVAAVATRDRNPGA